MATKKTYAEAAYRLEFMLRDVRTTNATAAQRMKDDAATRFLLESLRDLDAGLRSLNSRLIVLDGAPEVALRAALAEIDARVVQLQQRIAARAADGPRGGRALRGRGRRRRRGGDGRLLRTAALARSHECRVGPRGPSASSSSRSCLATSGPITLPLPESGCSVQFSPSS